jgi:hypothetical protein
MEARSRLGLRVIAAVPRFRPVEFTAACSIATLQPIARRIAALGRRGQHHRLRLQRPTRKLPGERMSRCRQLWAAIESGFCLPYTIIERDAKCES